LKNDDAQLRVRAAKNIHQIAAALGPDRTRNELIPFLSESLDDEDEVLQIIAENIGHLVNSMGEAQYVYILLGPLEFLSTVEESGIRDAAVKSVETVVKSMPDTHIVDHYFPFIIKLASKDWYNWFTGSFGQYLIYFYTQVYF